MSRYFFLLLIALLFGSSIAVSFASPVAPNDWTNEAAKQKFKQVTLKICDNYQPKYLALGIEVNTYYQYHPEDFDRFVEMYKDIYDTVKNNPIYANTQVYVTFQLEKMKGLGKAVGFSGQAQWEMLNKFDGKLDLLAFTTYPEIEYRSPADIPADYYTGIYRNLPINLQDKKIAIAEMGWNSENLIPVTGKNNTYQTQVKFIERIAQLINDLKDAKKVEYVAWSFMHDLKNTGFNPFRTIGLLGSQGKAKDPNNSVLKMWVSFYQFERSSFKVGIGPIPRNFPGSSAKDWLDMYQKLPGLANLILAQTDWFDSPEKAGEVPRLFEDLKTTKPYHQADCLYGINFFDLANGEPKITKR